MAFFIAYGAFSIPAGIIMSKLGYIRTFVLGVIIVAAAAFLFIPASAAASYPGFLAALFCIGAGIAVLQVAMNPVITTLRSEEHTVDVQSLMRISYAGFCLKKKIRINKTTDE